MFPGAQDLAGRSPMMHEGTDDARGDGLAFARYKPGCAPPMAVVTDVHRQMRAQTDDDRVVAFGRGARVLYEMWVLTDGQ